MSEVKLNLTDSQHILHGTIHGSIADSVVAALSAEPETIAELEGALARYIKPDATTGPFASFHKGTYIDERPWDAGIIVIDLAARIIACESTYSHPGSKGHVSYHDGTSATDVTVSYRLPDDWAFLDSVAEYEGLRRRRIQQRLANPPFDARPTLYGRPLLEFIARKVAQTSVHTRDDKPVDSDHSNEAIQDTIVKQISALHARWLMTPRHELQGQSPRAVLLARRDFIDYDLHTRAEQWSFQGEGPPCLSTDSFAYRFAGFGTHEWVIYYDLVRHLLWNALARETEMGRPVEMEMITHLESVKNDWLASPQRDYDGRIPALLIDNERKRLPVAIRGRDMVIDKDCPMCQMMADETAFGSDVGFWHLDGSHMDDDFAFSSFQTREEWEAENRRHEKFNREFNRRWEARQQCIARGEPMVPDPFLDPGLPFDFKAFELEEVLDRDHPRDRDTECIQ